MKILIIHCAYQYKGGEDTVVAEEVDLLRSSGASVELLMFSNKGNAFLNVVQIPFNWSAYKTTLRTVRKFQPHVVHIHNLHFAASPSVLYALKKTGIPYVCTLHNFRLLCPSAILFYEGKAFLNSLTEHFPITAVRKGVYKHSIPLTFWLAVSMKLHQRLGIWKTVHRFIVLSRHAKEIFLSSRLGIREEKFVIKPNFCFSPPYVKVEDQNFFLYVGRLSEEKGIRLLLSVFSRSRYTLKIIGDGPLLSEVMQAAAANNNIQFLGSKTKGEVFELLGSCTALIFPSIWFEGMPLTIIEAFACGTPVITSELGAMEFMVTPNVDGLHFKANDEADMISKLDYWQQLPAAGKEVYRDNARKTYEERYTPEANARQLLAIYSSVIAPSAVTNLPLSFQGNPV